MFGKKKKKVEDVQENLSKINSLRMTTESLIYMATDENVKERLEKVSDVLKYMAPTKKVELIKVEEKIANKLDDLKIVLSGKNDLNKINVLLQDVELLLIERKNNF